MAGARKIVYIISDINKALAFEWIAENISKERFELSFILLNSGSSVLEEYLKSNNFLVYRVHCRGKADWARAIVKTYKYLKHINPDIVHCHLIQANIIGLIASKLVGVKHRIYTRHHSSFHHVYFPKGIVWDKLANYLATRIVAISGIVKNILLDWERVNNNKIVLIPHGFKLKQFEVVDEERVFSFKKRYNLESSLFVVGVISRFTKLKGVQYVIPAFQQFLDFQPDAVLLLMNSHGDYEEEILALLNKLPDSSYRLIKFENDIAAAYKSMNVFIHVPIDKHSEAFGQIYVESLAASTPSIFTHSGIANEPYFNNQVALFVEYENTEQIFNALMDTKVNQFSVEKRVHAGREMVRRFDLEFYIQGLENLYTSCK